MLFGDLIVKIPEKEAVVEQDKQEAAPATPRPRSIGGRRAGGS